MVRCYLKTTSLKKILQFQDRICLFFLLKTQKATTFQQVTGGKIPNLVLKKMLELFLKIQPLKKILEFQDWKKPAKLIAKRKLQTRVVYGIETKLVSNCEQNMSYK